jgi:surface protein
MTTNMDSIFRASDAATITLGNINTSNVTNMASMFGQMSRLTSIDNLSFDTHNVTDMSDMFYDSHSLTELDLSNFDTSSVENMEYMFAGCYSLTSLNISSFETSKVTDMYSMFKYDSALTEINVSDFDTSNVTDMSLMFEGCTSLSSIDVTNFDTQNANSLDGMFKDCSLLTTLDLSSFDTQNVMSISEMFSGDTSLETIYVSDAWSTNIIADWGRYDVFSYDENLVGGAGTVFDEEHTNYEYARIDGGVDNPGYLTLKVDQVLPTDFDFDEDDIKMVVGQVHQIGVTFTPEGSGDTITYTGYDDTKISVVDGLITGLSEGTTTIKVGTENTDIEKTISITVLSDKLESTNYTVEDKEKEDQTVDRIVIGAEPGTTIQEFKDNMLNPVNYIKIYDGDTELSDNDIVKTGLTIKLEINGIVHDEAIIIIRGDINEDGLVNVIDKSIISEHVLRLNNIEGYRTYAADVDSNDSINVADKSKLSEYILRLIDSLNE